MKHKITILFGGESAEHTVSCKSAKTIIDNFDRDRYDLTLVGITKDGEWRRFDGDPSLIPTDEWETAPESVPVFLSLGGVKKGLFTMEDHAQKYIETELFFPVLHGKYGEDGTIQGLFEMLGVPYVGCGVSASANAMDKSLTKILVDSIGIKQARYVAIDRWNAQDIDGIVAECKNKLGFPMFVKPCASGSSIGITKATDEETLRRGILLALKHDTHVLIEEFINARELECAVIDDGKTLAAEVGEVIAADEFYDFDSKYNNAASVTSVTPDISPELEKRIKESAKAIFRVLDCRSLSRVDFFLDRDTGDLIFNEINTLPGFTSISMYPMLIEKHGISREELVDKLITEALRK
jgi:D-alanine-D-alanine ligase